MRLSFTSNTSLADAPPHYTNIDFTTGASSMAEFVSTFDTENFVSNYAIMSNGGGGQDYMYFTIGSSSLSAVPEPSTYAVLLGLSVLGLATYRRRQNGRP